MKNNKIINENLIVDITENRLKEVIEDALKEYYAGDPDMLDFTHVEVAEHDKYFFVSVGAELEYDELEDLADYLDKVIIKYDDDAYFEPASPGLLEAYLWKNNAEENYPEL